MTFLLLLLLPRCQLNNVNSDRINGAVSVAENGDQLKKDRQPGRHADDVKHNDLEQPVGQPADRAVGVRVRVRVEIRVRVSRVASR